MVRLPSYLQINQHGIYYFRSVFPKPIRLQLHKKEFRRSLRTSDRRIAVWISRLFKVKTDRLFTDIVKYHMNWEETQKLLDTIASETLAEFKDFLNVQGAYPDNYADYPERGAEEDAQYYLEMKGYPLDHPDINYTDDELENTFGLASKAAQDIIWRKNGARLSEIESIKDLAQKIITDHKLDVSGEDGELFCLKVAEMLQRLSKGRNDLIDRLQSGLSGFESSDDIQVLEDSPITHGTTRSVNKKSKSITLNELIQKFIDFKLLKNKWSPDTQKQRVNQLRYIEDILKYIKGKNRIYLNTFSAEDTDKFEKVLRMMPSDRSKFKDNSIAKLVEMYKQGKFPLKERMSDSTYNSYCEVLTGLFNYAINPRQNFIAHNYFIDMTVDVTDSTSYSPFMPQDLDLFFNTPLFSKKDFKLRFAWRYFIPIMMAYHGMRLEESSQLLVSQVRKEDGIDCFIIEEKIDELGNYITKLKTESSERKIPIHPTLHKIGFMKYINYLKRNGDEKIFPTLSNVTKAGEYKKSGASVSKFFNEDDKKHYRKSYITKCGINAVDNEKKVLYSFRHTVQHLLNNHPSNIENDKIDQLFGHSIKAIGRKHYGGYDPATMLKVVELIDYPNANLPWDTNPDYHKIKFPWEK